MVLNLAAYWEAQVVAKSAVAMVVMMVVLSEVDMVAK